MTWGGFRSRPPFRRRSLWVPTAAAGADVTAPVLTGAVINGAVLVLTYNEALDPASVPVVGDYAPKVNTVTVGEASVVVSGSTVTVTLLAAVVAGDTVTISYTAGVDPVQDVAGNNAANLTDQAVTNSTPAVPLSTTQPFYVCEVAFASDPGDTPDVWTDVSQWMLGFSFRRGRQKELDRIDTGTMMVRFRNEDRRFDPTHTASPYYPNVLPMRKIRLRVIYDSVTYDLFSGFVEAWPQTWEGPTMGFSEITAVDAFLPLSKVDVGENETWPREFAGARITRILDAAGWPVANRVIDTGYSEISEVTFALGAGVTALDAIRDVAGAELGTFFVDGSGRAVFHDRHHRRAASYLTSQATFGDELSGGLPYQSVVLDTDADRIWNDIQVTAPGGVTQRAEDSASQTKYLRRSMARQVPLARDTEAADQAAYLLAQYKDPKNRLAGITFTPRTAAMWEQAFGRELGDHITAERWPQGVGSQIVQECSIENIAIRWTANPGVTQPTYLLSTPAYTSVDWWILGDSTYGVLGSTTKLVY